MINHFTALQQLALSKTPVLASEQTADDQCDFRWYVAEINRFIVGINFKKVQDMLVYLNISSDSKEKLRNWFKDFETIWEMWNYNITMGFGESYRKAQSGNNSIEESFPRIIMALHNLAQNPDDPKAEDWKEFVDSELMSMQCWTGSVNSALKNLNGNLQKFIDSFDTQKKLFTQICGQILKEKNADQSLIDELQGLMDTYEKNIANLQKSIIAMSVVDGIGILGSVGAIIGAFFTAGVTLALLVPCLPIVGTTSYMIAKYKQEIKELQDKIDTYKEKQGEIVQEIYLLNGLNHSVNGYSDKSDTIKKYVTEAAKPWEALECDMKTILDDIKKPANFSTAADYAAYEHSFEEAQNLWKDIFMPEIDKLQLTDTVVVDTPDGFTIDNPEDWEKAVKQYSVSIEEYTNNKIS